MARVEHLASEATEVGDSGTFQTEAAAANRLAEEMSMALTLVAAVVAVVHAAVRVDVEVG